MEEKQLQIDHRVPYEVAGDISNVKELDPDDFMLLSSSANRAKSWSCENCDNWNNDKNIDICKSCYWAYPENYTHIAMRDIRRVDLIWEGEEISEYEDLPKESKTKSMTIQSWIKQIIQSRADKK